MEKTSTYDAAAPALLKMERAAIAAASHITYHPPELLGLIRDHLCAAGLTETAAALDRETADSEGSALKGLQTLSSAFPGSPFSRSLVMLWQSLHAKADLIACAASCCCGNSIPNLHWAHNLAGIHSIDANRHGQYWITVVMCTTSLMELWDIADRAGGIKQVALLFLTADCSCLQMSPLTLTFAAGSSTVRKRIAFAPSIKGMADRACWECKPSSGTPRQAVADPKAELGNCSASQAPSEFTSREDPLCNGLADSAEGPSQPFTAAPTRPGFKTPFTGRKRVASVQLEPQAHPSIRYIPKT